MTHNVIMERATPESKATWWLDCSCGWFHGYGTRESALEAMRHHAREGGVS